MFKLDPYYIATILFLLFIFACKSRNEKSGTVVFDVGFEELKNYQGICRIDGEEEIYFFKSKFNPQVKFYDLKGNLKDSLSLKQVEDSIGKIGLFSFVSKDTMIVLSYETNQMVGLKRNGSFLFNLNLDSLSAPNDENKYCFWSSFTPSPIHIGDNIIFKLMWNGKYRNKYQANSASDYYKHILISRMHSPSVSKIEDIYSGSPQIKYGMRDYYYNKSPELISYGGSEKNYAILNDKLFFIIANERSIYELDTNSLEVTDTIPIIPEEYEIPTGIKLINKPGISEDMMAEQELMEKCRITNMLYSQTKKQYYIFLRTAKDLSAVDELGYPFKLYVYDNRFKKKKEYTFKTDQYNPKSAMMTSKGIMIEKINKNQEYGKKFFEFIDL